MQCYFYSKPFICLYNALNEAIHFNLSPFKLSMSAGTARHMEYTCTVSAVYVYCTNIA